MELDDLLPEIEKLVMQQPTRLERIVLALIHNNAYLLDMEKGAMCATTGHDHIKDDWRGEWARRIVSHAWMINDEFPAHPGHRLPQFDNAGRAHYYGHDEVSVSNERIESLIRVYASRDANGPGIANALRELLALRRDALPELSRLRLDLQDTLDVLEALYIHADESDGVGHEKQLYAALGRALALLHRFDRMLTK